MRRVALDDGGWFDRDRARRWEESKTHDGRNWLASYVENGECSTHALSESDAVKLEAARAYLDRLDAVYASLADEMVSAAESSKRGAR